jgi:hypothetical protein
MSEVKLDCSNALPMDSSDETVSQKNVFVFNKSAQDDFELCNLETVGIPKPDLAQLRYVDVQIGDDQTFGNSVSALYDSGAEIALFNPKVSGS